MYAKKVKIENKTGLHARPASVEISAEGSDEKEAVDALVALIETKFGED